MAKTAEAREVFLGANEPSEQFGPRPSTTLFLSVAVAALSPLLFGIALAFTSPAEDAMAGEAKGGVSPPADLVVMGKSDFKWYASLVNVGCVAGAFIGTHLNDTIGRRKSLALSAVPEVVAYIGTMLSSSFAPLLFFRLLLGVGVGIGSAVCPVYISEVATTSTRGLLGAVHQLAVTLGILLANLIGEYVFTMKEQGQTFCRWQLLALFGAITAFILLASYFLPESPSYLAKKGDTEGMEASLRKLRVGRIEEECRQLVNSSSPVANGDASSANSGSGVRLGDFQKSLTIGVGLMAFQQFSGINAIIMFTGTICKTAGGGDETAALAAVLVMFAQVFFTAVACMLMDSAGRRSLLLLGTAGMTVGHALIAFHAAVSGAPAIFAFAGLGIVIIGFSLALGPIPWLIVGEIFPTTIRAQAASICTATSWVGSFIVTWGFDPMVEALGDAGVFSLFCVVCAACLVFVFFLVPETKGKSVEDVLSVLGTSMQTPTLSAECSTSVTQSVAPSLPA
eukprot:TRINITY_DN22140_c0_g1_i1.p1 TRINITY_DN22140_c0_g1~~TRINITY_DN22140_c0_g1_i1.p1  ORF type:complete len:510 (+),score=113.10 TRINITY_DN22140_c0_g1_i1:80-1609(+)